ncbi:MAG: S41 family peptidase [bacterium]
MLGHGRLRYVTLIFLSVFVAIIIIFAYLFGSYTAEQRFVQIEPDDPVQDFVKQGQKEFGNKLDFSLFLEVWRFILDEYVDKDELTNEQLFYGALKGLVMSTNDPHSIFLDPEMNKEFQIELSGTFEGIGAEIGIKDEIITIIAPLEGMPAGKAGLMAGDKVIKIDNELTYGMTVMDAVRKIRGPKNTDVVLTVMREHKEAPLDITITRGVIIVKSVESELRDDNIYVIKISNFADDTGILFNQAIGEVLINDPAGIILDLRNNPGGYLQTAISMASQWLKQDLLVVTEKYSEEEKVDHHATGLSRLAGYATVVLVNQGSASASEIVSGALQDHGLATIVGKQTFGKGSVQVLKELRDGSALKITTAKWLTPNGRDISEEGIMPDIEIEFAQEDYDNKKDPQMDKAVEILNDL